jgi:hypothetical protein
MSVHNVQILFLLVLIDLGVFGSSSWNSKIILWGARISAFTDGIETTGKQEASKQKSGLCKISMEFGSRSR